MCTVCDSTYGCRVSFTEILLKIIFATTCYNSEVTGIPWMLQGLRVISFSVHFLYSSCYQQNNPLKTYRGGKGFHSDPPTEIHHIQTNPPKRMMAASLIICIPVPHLKLKVIRDVDHVSHTDHDASGKNNDTRSSRVVWILKTLQRSNRNGDPTQLA